MGSQQPTPAIRRLRRLAGRTARKLGVLPPPPPRTPPVAKNPRKPGVDREALRLSVDSARQPMAEGDWFEAINRWEEVIDRFGPTSSWSAYRGLIVSYSEAGQPGSANAVAARARELFPQSVELAVAWAGLPMSEENWHEAIDRWDRILVDHGPQSSWKPYRGLANCYEQLGELDKAIEVAEEGYRQFPEDPEIAVTWGQMAAISENWPEAVSRWEQILDRFEGNVPWKVYLRLALAHGRQGDLSTAATVLKQGRAKFPNELSMIGHAAELAMAQRDWPEALARWNDVLAARLRDPDSDLTHTSFARRGGEWPWYEEAWQTIARDWSRIDAELSFRPSPSLYRSLGLTLDQAGLSAESLVLLRHGMAAHPADSSVAFDVAVAYLDMRRDTGRAAEVADLAEELDGHPVMTRVCNESADPTSDPIAATCASNRDTLAEFRPSATEDAGELGSIHLIRAPRDSSIELQLRAGRYYSPTSIQASVRALSERDSWEEMTAPENLMFKRARALSIEFGRRFEDPPLLSAEALADAVLFFMFHELCLYLPMKRLAVEIAAGDDGSPVFIESPTDTFRYVDGYSFSNFDVLYLYFELRKRGVNAFLCRYHQGIPPEHRRLRFAPGVRAVRPRGDVQKTAAPLHSRALVPAGIRSVRRVVGALGETLVYSSGSVVKEFAYDRSFRQEFPIEPEASFHPSRDTLPTYEFDLWPAATLHGVPLRQEEGLEAVATVEVSEPLGGDWLEWLDKSLHPFLSGMSSNAFAEVAARDIEEVHVCDHLFTDSVLFANAVKESGGRVVLWPHSANPVHVNERRPESFDEVHAVTRSGCEQWRQRFPDVPVTHNPGVMLDPPTRDTSIDSDQPLSVVIIGGRSVLRHMPILDRSLHEKSYRDFFAGLEKLGETKPVNVYFKPRGHTGEHEMWLSKMVGSTGSWERVLEHPLRIDLPNMIFASISMGSSALLEGLSRGIPGFVVRDFPVRDYTTLDPATFPTGTVAEMLDVVSSCLEPGGYTKLLEHEMQYYASELEVGDPL